MSTPLMKQYVQVKARYPDTILLFRMGDFFETFEEDAKITARVLGITLTSRGNGAAGEVPLAGFPHHALDAYLPKLLKAGHRVAVCEQLEDPKFAKGIVKRDVIEVVTPGVAFSDKCWSRSRTTSLPPWRSRTPSRQATTGRARLRRCVAPPNSGSASSPSAASRNSSGFWSLRDPGPAAGHGLAQGTAANRFHGLYTNIEDWIFNPDYCHDLLIGHFQTQSLKGSAWRS